MATLRPTFLTNNRRRQANGSSSSMVASANSTAFQNTNSKQRNSGSTTASSSTRTFRASAANTTHATSPCDSNNNNNNSRRSSANHLTETKLVKYPFMQVWYWIHVSMKSSNRLERCRRISLLERYRYIDWLGCSNFWDCTLQTLVCQRNKN